MLFLIGLIFPRSKNWEDFFSLTAVLYFQGSKLQTYMNQQQQLAKSLGGLHLNEQQQQQQPPVSSPATASSGFKKMSQLAVGGVPEFIPSSAAAAGLRSASRSNGNSISSSGLSPRHSPTPGLVGGGGPGSNNGEVVDINSFSDGGTTYFYSAEQEMVRFVVSFKSGFVPK